VAMQLHVLTTHKEIKVPVCYYTDNITDRLIN